MAYLQNFGRFLRLISTSFIIISLILLGCKQKDRTVESGKPEDNRFTKVVLAQGFNEPMAMAMLSDDRVLIVERKGALKVVNTTTNQVKTITTIPVNTKYVSKDGAVSEAEEGLMGIIAHPEFNKNHWIYMYYADPTESKHVLARWELKGDVLDSSTKKIVLEVPTQRETCCHTGGGMIFDKNGNLYLTIGNNTANPVSGTASYDERPGRSSWDDQRGSGNTNDLRGKILRIHPEDDGSYTIPAGNLFEKGTANTRPEIYVMGNRNPWRVSIDNNNGYLYWGEVGPDAATDSTYGPRGYDEFNQARKAGNFGWPYFIGDNMAYAKYNYADNTFGGKFNPEHPLNNSPNNTGLKELPPAQKAFIWYPYSTSDTFALVGSAGRSAVGGPVFHETDFKDAGRTWPSYFENKWLITDFMRGWLMAITMDKEGNYKSMEQVLPGQNFSSVIDMQFNPHGDLYFLEYGSSWFQGNANSALVRIEYNGGNRRPTVEATADKTAGSVPFKVGLSSKGTIDYDEYDKDALKYEWKIAGNGIEKTISEAEAAFTFDKPGNYDVTLTVTDTKGEKNSKTLKLVAGNEPPSVAVNILKGNKSFFFPNQPIEYAIEVSDKEDNNRSGAIMPDLVAVNFDYVPEGFDPIHIAQNHRAADERTGFSAGLYLMNSSDCKSCHMLDKKSAGPALMDIATKYKNDNTAIHNLANKIISGGSGVWGEQAMAAHPQITAIDAEAMVKYILSVGSKPAIEKPLPLKGSYVAKVPSGENGKGGYLLRAAYTDKGSNGVPPLSSENIVALRNPAMDPQFADIKKSTQLLTTPSISFSMLGDGSYFGYNNLDLSGIKGVRILYQATPTSGCVGGMIEIHLDSPDGKLIGQTEMILPKPFDMAALMEKGGGKPKGKGDEKAKKEPEIPANFDFSLLRILFASETKAAIQAVEGTHNVYFVFKNPQAKANQPLMELVVVEFQNL